MSDGCVDKESNDAQNFLAGAAMHLEDTRQQRLVSTVAARLVDAFKELGATMDGAAVEVGAALVDSGKRNTSLGQFPLEEGGEESQMNSEVHTSPGSTYAKYRRWISPEVTLEERTVYLAEGLSEHLREVGLELAIADQIAQRLGLEPAVVFRRLNGVLGEIESEGRKRICCIMPE